MKTNKFYITLAVIFTVMGLNANAQECGVYKTYEDYTNGKMEVSINCATKDGKIKPNNFFKTDYVTVTKKSEKIDLKKDEIFGYQLCNGEFFRFLNKDRLTLADKSGLWIYTKEEVVSYSPFTGTKKITKYYFSKEGSGEIKSLTFSNIKDVIPVNGPLYYEMELLFSSNSALHAYNQSSGSFKINSFLNSKGL
jgi:hypothetical protein